LIGSTSFPHKDKKKEGNPKKTKGREKGQRMEVKGIVKK